MVTIGLTVLAAQGADDDAFVRDEYRFMPSEQRQQDIEQTLAMAASNGKRAIVVFGAQWCHDSRSFSAKLSTDSVQKVMDKHYEVVFVDVGYLEDRRTEMAPLGYPINFGTPTVLVMEPKSRALINKSSVAKWQNAYKVEVEEFERYFIEHASREADLPTLEDPELKAFEQQKVQILADAYATLGPMLAEDQASEAESDEGFITLWREVYQYRSALQSDLLSLHQQLEAQVDTALAFPDYPIHSWQTE